MKKKRLTHRGLRLDHFSARLVRAELHRTMKSANTLRVPTRRTVARTPVITTPLQDASGSVPGARPAGWAARLEPPGFIAATSLWSLGLRRSTPRKPAAARFSVLLLTRRRGRFNPQACRTGVAVLAATASQYHRPAMNPDNHRFSVFHASRSQSYAPYRGSLRRKACTRIRTRRGAMFLRATLCRCCASLIPPLRSSSGTPVVRAATAGLS